MNYFSNKEFTFIDLFAGIGGFHQALSNLGGKCVFASEIDSYAIETYNQNYNINSAHDITTTDEKEIPPHDVLCAGFPCQTFSKAGSQKGFADTTRGNLFFQILRILQKHKPKFIILENVRNLTSHDHGNTWKIIHNSLKELGYILPSEPIIMSPHQLGIPQLRERVYILGVHKSLGVNELHFIIPPQTKPSLSIYNTPILEKRSIAKYAITPEEEKVLTCWNEFYQGIKERVIGFPIWSSEFRQTYNLDNYPSWKKEFCLKNRALYLNNKNFIDKWLKKWNNLQDFTPTNRKFEWQAGSAIPSLWDGIIQFRPSGIRVKRPDSFPALVAMVQIPIIGKYKRRLTPREAARLQSFPDSFIPNNNDHQAYKQLGNAVNINCVEYLAKQLFNLEQHREKSYDSLQLDLFSQNALVNNSII